MAVKSKHSAQFKTVIQADKKTHTQSCWGMYISLGGVGWGDLTLIYSSRCVEQ